VPASPAMPGSFNSTPIMVDKTNGATSNGQAPPPPPHKSAPTSPEPARAPTTEDAENFKNSGNQFYKTKDYKKAVEEYTKGTLCRIKLLPALNL
jgi:DnaJ family protein C protein 7